MQHYIALHVWQWTTVVHSYSSVYCRTHCLAMLHYITLHIWQWTTVVYFLQYSLSALSCTALQCMSSSATLQFTLCSVVHSLQYITLHCNASQYAAISDCTGLNALNLKALTATYLFCAKLGEAEYELTQPILFNRL